VSYLFVLVFHLFVVGIEGRLGEQEADFNLSLYCDVDCYYQNRQPTAGNYVEVDLRRRRGVADGGRGSRTSFRTRSIGTEFCTNVIMNEFCVWLKFDNVKLNEMNKGP